MAANWIPKSEKVWEEIIEGKTIYYVTSKADRGAYYLYKKEGDKIRKLGQAKTPVLLKEKYLKQ